MKSITKIFKGVVVLGVILLFSNSYSQTKEWVQRYNGALNGPDEFTCLAVDNAGNSYLAGFVGNLTYDYIIAKYNSSGNEIWNKSYNGSGNGDDWAHDIVVDQSGNIYITGESEGSSNDDEDIVTIKYNSAGTVQWIQRYNGTADGYDSGRKIIVDNSGNVYVGGNSSGVGSNTDMVLIKYNSSGTELWVQRFNGVGNDYERLGDMKMDASGNIVVTGASVWTGVSSDIATIKFNGSTGTQIWVARYNGPGNVNDDSYSLDFDASGNIYVVGGSGGLGTSSDITTIKYNSTGSQQWVQRYNGAGNSTDRGNMIAVDNAGNSHVTGFVSEAGATKMITIKYNTAGAERWAKLYEGPDGYDFGTSIMLDNAGNVYAGGTSTVLSSNTDFVLAKYTSNGTLVFTKTYNGGANGADGINDLYVHPSGATIFSAGYSLGIGTNYDGVVIKYSQLTGTEIMSNEIPAKFSLSQNYPNPFNPSTKIEFSLPESGNVKMDVFDIKGRHISELVNGSFSAGVHSVNFDAGSISAGVYYYRIQYNGISEVKKMMLIK